MIQIPLLQPNKDAAQDSHALQTKIISLIKKPDLSFLENKEEAMELYKKLITTYPSSLFVVESRKRFRALRGDKLTEEELNKGI